MRNSVEHFEVVTYKIRALSHDKKMHVFRVLLYPTQLSFKVFNDKCKKKFDELFPSGYRFVSVERFVIDFELNGDWSECLCELCPHDYLAKYLTSIEKLE